MKIYLDTCTVCRPFDDQTQLRIRLETEAIAALIAMIEQAELQLISSAVLQYEANQNRREESRVFTLNLLEKASQFVAFEDKVIKRAKNLETLGVHNMDALHLASAEFANADYFCTCDDKFLRRVKRLNLTTLRVLYPFELIQELEK